MGIPYFFSWITKKYPLTLIDIDINHMPTVDCLYFDMNGIIYRHDQKIFLKDQLFAKQFDQIWAGIINFLDNVINLLKPTNLIYIGFDGVAPLAKMNQQRQRRFLASKYYNSLYQTLQLFGNIENTQNFKLHSISPGTQFMRQLNHLIQFYIAKKIQENQNWRKIQIIYSSANVPGQGQHKILQYMRTNSNNKAFNQLTHCIYGADSDLIMLSLTLPFSPIIIRQGKQNYQLLFTNLIKECMDIQFKKISSQMKIQYKIERVLDDFVILGFVIGNDFLPRGYCCNIRQGNFDIIVQEFKKWLKITPSYMNNKGQLNLQCLCKIFQMLQNLQPDLLHSKIEQIKKFNSKPKLITNQLNFFQKMQNIFHGQDIHQAKKLFYSKKFIEEWNDNAEIAISNIVQKWVEGIHFVAKYYFQKLPSWTWYYPYYYSPFFSDISQKESIFKFQLGKPFQPFRQLLHILPNTSYLLLPQFLHHLIKDKTSILRTPVDFYPQNFDIDQFGVMIPFLDMNLIEKVYKLPQNISDELLQRNSQQKNKMFIYGGQMMTFRSLIPMLKDARIQLTIKTQNFPQLSCRKQSLTPPSLKDKITKSKIRHYRYFSQLFKRLIVQFIENEEKYQEGDIIFYGFPFERPVMYVDQQEMNQNDLYINKLEQKGILISNITQNDRMLIVKPLLNRKRTYNGNYIYNFSQSQQQLVYSRLISKTFNYYWNYKEKNWTNLQEQFPNNVEVVILSGTYAGSIGRIIDRQELNVTIKITDYQIPQQIRDSDKIQKNYYTLTFISKKLKMNKRLILSLLDSILVELFDHPKIDNYDLPRQLDLGMQLISKKQNKLSSSLCRIQKPVYLQGRQKYKQFYRLQLSLNAIQILIQYIKKFPMIVEKVRELQFQRRFSDNKSGHNLWTINQIGGWDAVMACWIWKMGKEYVHLPLTSIFSKSYNIEQIQYLTMQLNNLLITKQFNQNNQNQTYYISKNSSLIKKKLKFLTINANHVLTKEQAALGLIYLDQEPEYHQVGDRVVCLDPDFFPARGLIVGINKEQIQVLFQKPMIGLTNLNGRCQLMRGKIFYNFELFNVQTMKNGVISRVKDKNSSEEKGWNGIFQSYCPVFENKATDQQIDQLLIDEQNVGEINEEQKELLDSVQKDENEFIKKLEQQDYKKRFKKKQRNQNEYRNKKQKKKNYIQVGIYQQQYVQNKQLKEVKKVKTIIKYQEIKENQIKQNQKPKTKQKQKTKVLLINSNKEIKKQLNQQIKPLDTQEKLQRQIIQQQK